MTYRGENLWSAPPGHRYRPTKTSTRLTPGVVTYLVEKLWSTPPGHR